MRRLRRPQNLPWLIAALALLVLAGFFRFALIGYGTIALACAGAAAVIVLWLLLPKGWRIALAAVLLAGTALFAAAEIPIVRASRGTPEADADYLIVLGAGVNGSVPSLSMANRLTAALAWLEAHPDCTAVLTGGQGEGEQVTEASAMATWLTARGIPAERLILEERATSTMENLAYSFALIPDVGTARMLVCSSEYHLCRAELMARALGHELGGVPARTTYPVLRLNYFIREAFGVVHFWLLGR